MYITQEGQSFLNAGHTVWTRSFVGIICIDGIDSCLLVRINVSVYNFDVVLNMIPVDEGESTTRRESRCVV